MPIKDIHTFFGTFTLNRPVPETSDASTSGLPQPNNDDPLDIPRKYVGDVNLPKCEEPLLKESRRRFILFPIQYHQVHPLKLSSFDTS